MVRNDIKKSSLLRTKILIYAFNGRTLLKGAAIFSPFHSFTFSPLKGVSHLFTFSLFHPFNFKSLFTFTSHNPFKNTEK